MLRGRKEPILSDGALTKVAGMRTIFAHQSVGWNVIDGVQEIAKAGGVQVNIQETRVPPASGHGIFHFMVGLNQDPLGKINDFETTLLAPGMPPVDVAMLKLCYVDFNTSTDAEALATEYLAALDRVAQRRPGIRVVAITAPLTTPPSMPKEWIKNLMGRPSLVAAENAKRYTFNQIVRARTPGNMLFDIARIEAREGDAGVEYLRRELTSDRGHLNDAGMRLAAHEFLRVLGA
jgi:hypothetical protein